MVLGVLTGTSETVTTREGVSNDSHSYGSLDTHVYSTPPVDLMSGTYELRFNFSSSEVVSPFYVRVFDPDGIEIASVYGPPPVYQNQSAQLTFETQRAGQHTFVLGGRWVSVRVTLYRLTQSTRTVYPYEVVLYAGLVLLTGGVILTLSGASMKEKRQAQWYDQPR
jgi:hypothetical protein